MRTLRQVVEVIHPGLAGVSKKDLQEKLCKMYKVRQRQAATSQPYATPQHLPVERWPHVPGVAAFSVCGPLCDGSVHRTPCSAPSRTLLPPHTSAPRLLEREVSASAAPTRPAGAGQQLLLAVRLQGCLRWRPEHRVRYDLRQPRGCQEVRAQVPPHTGAPRRHRSYRGAKRIEAPRWRERRALLLRRGTRSRRAAASPRAASVAQFGMGKAKTTARKQRKERKNRAKKARPRPRPSTLDPDPRPRLSTPDPRPPPLATLAALCSHSRHTPTLDSLHAQAVEYGSPCPLEPGRCVVSRRPRRWALRRQLLVDSSRRWDINGKYHLCIRFLRHRELWP